jgi:hypothetical protein
MGLKLGSSIAPAHDAAETGVVKTLDQRLAERAAKRASNQNWRVLPLGALDDATDVLIAEHNAAEARKKAKRSNTKPDVTERDGEAAETSEQRIARLAQAAHEANAAISAAIGLSYAQRGEVPLSGAELEAKRQILWTPAVESELLIRVAEGESVFKVCADRHMPHRTTAYDKIGKDPTLAGRYQAALHHRADKLMEQVVEESRILKDRAAHGASTEEVNAHKAYINSLQWTAARLNPGKYGDRVTQDINATVTTTPEQVHQKLLALLTKATRRQAPTDEDADANS